jgi:hypothetical protein
MNEPKRAHSSLSARAVSETHQASVWPKIEPSGEVVASNPFARVPVEGVAHRAPREERTLRDENVNLRETLRRTVFVHHVLHPDADASKLAFANEKRLPSHVHAQKPHGLPFHQRLSAPFGFFG